MLICSTLFDLLCLWLFAWNWRAIVGHIVVVVVVAFSAAAVVAATVAVHWICLVSPAFLRFSLAYPFSFSFVWNTMISHEEKSKFSLCLHERQDDKKLHPAQAHAYTNTPKTMNWILFDFVYVNFVCLFAVIIYKRTQGAIKCLLFHFSRCRKEMPSFQWI